MAGDDERTGLQAERTLLAWDRTTLGILANGALLVLRDTTPRHLDRWPVAVGALVVAGLCVLGRRWRGHTLHRLRRPHVRTAHIEVALLGGGVTLLGTAVLAFILVEWAVG